MENKHDNVLDDLNSPSITKDEPPFSLANTFKPTPKNKIIIGMMIKVISIGLMALGSVLLGMVAVVADLSHTLLGVGIAMNILGLVGGAIGESIILFTKEEPLSSLVRAAEDIKLDAVKAVETQTEQSIEQPHDS